MDLKKVVLIGFLMIYGLSFGYATPGQASEFKVFPNPVTDNTLSIQSESIFHKIEILSIVGQVIYSEELEPSKSVRLNINLQSGMYLLRISYTDQNNNTKRIWVK